MKGIVNEYLNITLYIDDWCDYGVTVSDKVRVYDSKNEYLTYFEADYILARADKYKIKPEEYIIYLLVRIAEAKTVEELLESALGLHSYVIDEDINNVILNHICHSSTCDEKIEMLAEASTLKTTEEKLKWLENNSEGLNFLGNYILLNYEY